MAAIFEPKITSVTISPNPANINQSILISVTVTDVQVTLYNVWPISGAYTAGQTINLVTGKEVAS